jgi:small subunit ribosomal protein S16
MLTIRLQRAGKKNRPEYRIILAEKTSAASKKFLEVLGNYNPHTKALILRNQERLQYWISQRVALSPTVHNLLVSNNLITEKKTQAFTIPKKPVVAEEKPAEVVAEPAPESAPTEPAPAPEVAPEATPEEVPSAEPAA